MQDLERNSTPPDTFSEAMRVRCPYCRKLYMVQFSDVVEAKPRFECVDCRTKFWLSLPDMDLSAELVGIPAEVKKAPLTAKASDQNKKPCPKCFKPILVGSTECGSCGVVLGKIKQLDFVEKRINTPPRSETLALAWKTVISNYGEEGVHANFLRLATKEGHLAYAAFQYTQLKRLMPNDEITAKRIHAIETLSTEILAPTPESTGPAIQPYGRLWLVPLLASVLFTIVGVMIPIFHSVMSLGAASLFIAVVLRIQTRPR